MIKKIFIPIQNNETEMEEIKQKYKSLYDLYFKFKDKNIICNMEYSSTGNPIIHIFNIKEENLFRILIDDLKFKIINSSINKIKKNIKNFNFYMDEENILKIEDITKYKSSTYDSNKLFLFYLSFNSQF